MQGWVKLHRCLLDKPIWACSTPEQKVIFITLLLMANHEAKEWEWNGNKVVIRSGQFITSLEHIAKRAGVSIQNVRTALKRFENYEFLTDQSTNRGRLITIVNWELYQGDTSQTNKQTNKQLTGNQQAANKQLTTNKNDKNVKNDKKKIDMSKFEIFYQTYPRHQAKKDAAKAWMQVNGDKHFEEIMAAVEVQKKYVDAWVKNDIKHIPLPASWLRGERWKDEIKANQQPKPQSDLIQLEPWQLEAQKRRREKLAAKCIDGSV